MSAAHTDSPTFKIKSVPEITGPAEYIRLNVEAYGGMIDSTWLDRPLTIAGRVMVDTGNGLESRLVLYGSGYSDHSKHADPFQP